MRAIHIIIPKDKEKIVTTALGSLGIKHEKIEGSGNILLILTVAEEHVELVIDAIKKIGVGTIYGTYQIYNVESAPKPAKLGFKATKRASREEILSDFQEKAELTGNYVLSGISASVLATLGLLTDNIIITIASMIIAPYFGPMIGTSLGIVLNIDELRRESLKSEIIGLGLSVLTGFIFSMILPYTIPTSRMLAISNPTYIDIIFAIMAGLAAAISVVNVEATALVGVAIAASIVPPASNIGIGFAFLLKGVPSAYTLMFGSTILLAINVLAITTTSILFFWLTGIKPGESIRKELIAKKIAKQRLLALLISFFIVSIPILLLTLDHFEEKQIEREISDTIESFLSSNYPDLEIIDLNVVYTKAENMTYIYLTIGAHEINASLSNLAESLRILISNTYHIKTRIYLSVYLIA
ncbi:MAG: TIGR00341 family protein [Candidatus Njordarchaeia archaeon]|nr:TIGR00341 family protein [Candidatus Korarchaeota archaeon]